MCQIRAGGGCVSVPLRNCNGMMKICLVQQIEKLKRKIVVSNDVQELFNQSLNFQRKWIVL